MNSAPLNGFLLVAAIAAAPSGGLNSGPLAGLAMATSNVSSPSGGLLAFPPVVAQDLEQALYAKLMGSTPVGLYVQGRIFYAVLPQTLDLGRHGPALTYAVAERTPGHDLGGSDGTMTATLRIAAWAYREDMADRITEAVRNLLDGPPRSWGNGTMQVISCMQVDETDIPGMPRTGTDQWTYQIASDYSVKYRVTIPTLI